jgi:hypothetical protein
VNSLSVNRLLQKLAITVTHPFRRIRSFEDCLALETSIIARIASRRRGAVGSRYELWRGDSVRPEGRSHWRRIEKSETAL